MTILAILLLALGAADLARPIDARARGWVLGRALAAGAAVIALCWWGTGIDWWWGLALLAALAAWVVLTPWFGDAIPVIALAVVVLALIAFAGRLPAAHGWMPEKFATLASGPLAAASFVQLALAVGVVAFLADTSNIVVRLVLQATDSRALGTAPSLKGGRVLGPLERVFIFTMALAGQYLAITAVVAAKSIIRFPEISKDTHGTKAEYFLIGSFVSWGLGLLTALLFAFAG
jgi:hypothetical protein